MVAGAGGGTGVTTYAENIGVMAVTKIYSTLVFVVAALTAIVLGFSPKFGALIVTIPGPVLGGLAIVVFGLITATGGRIWVQNHVDFARARNLVTVGGHADDRRRRSRAEDRRLHAGRHRHRDVRRDPPLSIVARRRRMKSLLAAIFVCAAAAFVPAQAADSARTLRVAFTIAETSFDPAFASDAASDSVIANIFESMLDYDYLARPVKLVPRTLEAMPDVEDGGKTYVVQAAQGHLLHARSGVQGQAARADRRRLRLQLQAHPRSRA